MKMAILNTWICKKCGRTTRASSKPGENGTNYGKCKDGKEHVWIKKK